MNAAIYHLLMMFRKIVNVPPVGSGFRITNNGVFRVTNNGESRITNPS